MSKTVHVCAEQPVIGVRVFAGPRGELYVSLTADAFEDAADASVSVYGIRYCPWCGKDLSEEEGA